MDPDPFIPFGGDETQNIDITSADIVVLPLCYEKSSSYGMGSGKGPYHLLEASAQLEGIDEETLIHWGLFKIHTQTPLTPSNDPEKAVEEMKHAAGKVLNRNQFLLSIGGDHTIALGPILAASDIYPHLGVLQIDAHLDLRDQWNESPYNHACVMRRVAENSDAKIIPVGTRAVSAEEIGFMNEKGISPFFAHRIDPFNDTWMTEVVDALPENVYITIDLDGLDPAVIPGTGTPEPGGLSYRQLIALLNIVGKNRKVVAADINELVKIEGTQVSEYTAARIAQKIMVYCARRN